MKTDRCGSPDHRLHRRQFLQGTAAGALSVFSYSGLFSIPAFAEQARKEQKHVILLWLCGAPSQFETWDPKPGTPTGGPFRSIPTKLPGVHVSELMPRCASIMDKLAVIRSMKTSQNEHFQGIDLLNRGDAPRPPFIRPTLGSVLGQQLAQVDSPIPSFVLLDPCPEGNEFKAFKAANWAGWLGAEYGPVRVGGEFKIENIARPEALSDADHEEREALRRFLSRKYENDRKSAAAQSFNAAYERVKGLMSCAHLFDLERVPQKDRERYGPGTFAQHTLLARHLVENGAPFVMVANGMPWDCHVFNHEIHQMLVPELDQTIHHLITDLEERGLLDKTLVVMMGEFGRTPTLNDARGRDHYPNAWSMALAGCGIRGGVVYGATDENGVAVKENPVDQRRLFATIFTALGLDPHQQYDLPGLPTFYRVEGAAEPIREVLA
ncbi:MAG: hypothetical protein K0Q72_1414 [Armatimonadetes bacterium]|jgi:hypothetical protein|nr:hypothetical protein [Armatimonadota bacterium]